MKLFLCLIPILAVLLLLGGCGGIGTGKGFGTAYQISGERMVVNNQGSLSIVAPYASNNCENLEGFVDCSGSQTQNADKTVTASSAMLTTHDAELDLEKTCIYPDHTEKCLVAPVKVAYACHGTAAYIREGIAAFDWSGCVYDRPFQPGVGCANLKPIELSGTYIAAAHETSEIGRVTFQCYSYSANSRGGYAWTGSGVWYDIKAPAVSVQSPTGLAGKDYDANILICKSDNTCEHKTLKSVYPVPVPGIPAFEALKNSILSWISGFFDSIAALSIVGEAAPQAGSMQTYQLSLNAGPIDSDPSDGTYSARFANWALVRSDGTFVQQGQWERVNEVYQKNVEIKVPDSGNYAVIAVMTENKATIGSDGQTWNWQGDKILLKEGYNIKVKQTYPTPSPVTPGALSGFFSGLIDFIRGIFGVRSGV